MGEGKIVLGLQSLYLFLILSFSPIALVFQDLPAESTGELDHLRAFMEENMDVCKWVAIAVITIQVC